MNILEKYAHLLIHYCLEIKPGEKLFIQTTTLAEDLLREIYKCGIKAGAHVEFQMSFREQNRIFVNNASDEQLDYASPNMKNIMETFDAYLAVRAPFNAREDQNNDQKKSLRKHKAMSEINQIYFERIADKSLKRSLCQFPTQASAQEAGMSLDEYEQFVYNACNLYDKNPEAAWLKVRESQQKVVDYLNKSAQIRYVNDRTDISFSVKDRTWINSDGRNNMPSGEVFSSPVEESVNGFVYFNYPSIYMSNEVEGVRLEVKDGEVINWEAEKGKAFLDQIFNIEGSRYFGEVAIGTNYNIQQATKNILFDEKIGGSIHMALGQSYKQTGGKNKSDIHWDLITDMKNGGKIYADGVLIYENGYFIESIIK